MSSKLDVVKSVRLWLSFLGCGPLSVRRSVGADVKQSTTP
jgi:hypothetical protein